MQTSDTMATMTAESVLAETLAARDKMLANLRAAYNAKCAELEANRDHEKTILRERDEIGAAISAMTPRKKRGGGGE